MSTIVDLLKTIRDQGNAGDPAVQYTVVLLADLLEEQLNDPRVAWLRRLRVDEHEHGWKVNVSGLVQDTEPNAIRCLAHHVMQAMTRECPDCKGFGGAFYPDIPEHDTCYTCHGDGWLLTEAVACGKCDGRGNMRYGDCPDCDGQGWIKE